MTKQKQKYRIKHEWLCQYYIFCYLDDFEFTLYEQNYRCGLTGFLKEK